MKYSFLIGLLALLFGGSLSAVSPSEKPFVHGLFSDNMVLQRDAPCPIWGWTVPGATVTVEVAGKSASAVADASGKWEAVLEAMPAGGPYEMKITGPGKVTFKNVMTGDVWLCSGQSNMQMGMRSINQWWDEQSAADIPSLRLAIIPFSSLFEKPNTVNTDWNVSSKAFVFGNRPTSEGFSAIGFLFGRALNRELNVPVGLIESCWGATAISNWSSPAAVADLGIIKGQTPFEAFRDRIEKVWRERDPNFDAHIKWVEQGFDDSGWSEQNLPRSGSSVEPEAVGWYRKSIEIPAQWAGQELMISLPPVDGLDTVWWNGTFIDSSNVTDNQVFSRYYRVPGALVRAGRQTIAIRILAKRGLSGEPSSMSIKPVSGGDEIALAGPWKYNPGTPISELRKARYPERRNIETGCYQAMIAALAPFAIKGVIWYQGEGDTGRAGDYYASFSRMIADWRKLFRNESMPFYFVQLAGFGPQAVEPGGSGWASVRDAQRRFRRMCPIPAWLSRSIAGRFTISIRQTSRMSLIASQR